MGQQAQFNPGQVSNNPFVKPVKPWSQPMANPIQPLPNKGKLANSKNDQFEGSSFADMGYSADGSGLDGFEKMESLISPKAQAYLDNLERADRKAPKGKQDWI